jgi:hypothetical protein
MAEEEKEKKKNRTVNGTESSRRTDPGLLKNAEEPNSYNCFRSRK